MDISELKKGQKIYDVRYNRVTWYTYLCVHPESNSYHILIDMNEDPFRIYGDHLQAILNKNLSTYDEARLYLADKLEQQAISLRSKTE